MRIPPCSSPSHPCLSVSEMLPRLWWPLLGHLALPQAVFAPLSGNKKCKQELLNPPFTPQLHHNCTDLATELSLQRNGRGQRCITGKNHTNHSFLTQTALKKWLISPLVMSPLDKFTKYPKKHSNECCCYPQYRHSRLGFF